MESTTVLLDELLPEYDATRIERRLVAGEPAEVYARAREADFMRAWRDSTAVRVLFAARAAGERLASALGLTGRTTQPPETEAMRLADMRDHGEWVLLGESPPHEIAFGAIGRFWGGETEWRTISAAEFAGFDRPGVAKIACSFSLRPVGAGRTMVTYESRTRATDAESRRKFLRYWRLVSPGVGFVMRSMLRQVGGGREAGPVRSLSTTSRGFRAFNRAVNPIVRALLRSPLHRLLSSRVALITVTGRRSGRPITLPVGYTRRGDLVSVVVGWPERKTWWKNLRGGERGVALLIRGEELAGSADLHEEEGRVSVDVRLG